MSIVGLGLPTPRPPQAGASSGVPSDGPLRDTFGRVAKDLRVSVTDRCNLRCSYCMPAEGLDWMPADQVLDTAEMIRVLTIAVRDLGIERIRFTGGEPLLRRDLEHIISAVSALPQNPEIAMTTNGLGLTRRIGGLVEAGLDRINVSLDTVDRARFAEVTRRDRLGDVLDGLAAARDAGLAPVKVNAVVPDHADLDGLPDLLSYCLDHGYELRIIEQMPLDADHAWQRSQMVTADEILATLRARFTLLPDPKPRGSAPAATWLVEGRQAPGGRTARVGVIASVTRPFCGDCDRTRLTADGSLRNCLFATSETDLRTALRTLPEAQIDAAVAAIWRGDMWQKAAGHEVNAAGFVQPSRPMSAIGG
ncbi:GTP 3',8-cyclase MoaA [Gordonia jinghuaiqii]|uniref:GTP 3',8-cyclase n=1 Tax=Gordonia jinghuaiqii TaxID=2758710 RepID=A0A7D7QIY6_9ACTN|nr:GTP 3',8-cyclase MoaA [Gordonia jinghuaiqii]MCR5980628.1 GTP 3',8-cyclase MoaA [Gordonia jinghuaiqii]QMT02684.1 GTP 3',8-cyclase MoaA [Gordonia jinghuaiqii]